MDPTHIYPAAAPGAPAVACRVKRFQVSFEPWNISWPGWISDSTTIRLPVKFELALEDPSTRADCFIKQYKKGRVERGGKLDDEFPGWEADGEPGNYSWWDGTYWNAADGSWSWFSETASFRDEPGFNEVAKSDYPLYWCGVGHKGHFEFETHVCDVATWRTIRKVKWGLLIDFSAPRMGRHYFYR